MTKCCAPLVCYTGIFYSCASLLSALGLFRESPACVMVTLRSVFIPCPWPLSRVISGHLPQPWLRQGLGPESERRCGNADVQAAEGSQCSCCVIHHNLKHLFSFLFREVASPVSREALPVFLCKMAYREQGHQRRGVLSSNSHTHGTAAPCPQSCHVVTSKAHFSVSFK